MEYCSPGFGQLLNDKYIKGILFIFLEIIINVQGNFNEIIMLSFQGEIENAVVQANYQWLMFYPCLYSYAMWDAFKDSGGRGREPFPFFHFVLLILLRLVVFIPLVLGYLGYYWDQFGFLCYV